MEPPSPLVNEPEAPKSIPHPWSWVPPGTQTALFYFYFILAFVLFASLVALGRPLNTGAAPLGIVSFELAGDLATAQAILVSWGPEGRVYAGLNLGLDYLFLFAYAGALGLACVLVSKRFDAGSRRQTLGVLLSWAVILAAGLDAVENYALISLLLGLLDGNYAVIARSAAVVKFSVVIVAFLYLVVSLPLSLVKRSPRQS